MHAPQQRPPRGYIEPNVHSQGRIGSQGATKGPDATDLDAVWRNHMSFFVNAIAIRHWAERIDARSTFPQVIRRLATATVKGISESDLPAHESVQRPGFDGVIVCEVGNAWVPTGKSSWELSAEQGIKGKADRDFAKRTASTAQDIQEHSVFIFVTPRHWKNKDDWVLEQAGKGHWKEVRAYDCDDLEQWFEIAPPVAVWFAGQIGIRPVGVDDLAARWTAISRSTSRDLLPSLFLTGREQSIEKIREWLAGPPKWIAVACRSPLEVIDFICAWSASLEDKERSALESHAILVEDGSSWKFLRESQTPAVLIVDPSIPLSAEELSRAVSSGHHVLVAVEPTPDAGARTIELERAGQFELTQSLEACGYSPAEAEQFARASGGSLAVLKNRLSQIRASAAPALAAGFPQEVITACLLLGGWNEKNPADRAAFENLSGRSYGGCETDLQSLATCRDSLLLHAAGNWRLISKDEAWTIFGNRVPASALREFESLAVDILADDDPRFNLPEGDRYLAAIQGHVPKYSATIKKHVAETLALLGALGESFEASASINIQAAIDRIVSNVLSSTATWHRWASIGARLALLAEASPSSFLRAVSSDLDKSDPELLQLFREDGDVIFGSCNHAGLLWALETLAWSKLFLGEVAEILLMLADRDPGGKWSNRPGSTLCEILSYWIPHTTATCDERIKVLDLLIQRNREAAWPILLEFLPSAAGSRSIPTQKPYWRDWANSWSRGATYDESRQFILAAAERIISEARSDAGRWQKVFENVGRFTERVRPKLLEGARSLSKTGLSDNQRRVLAEALSEQIHTHRQFHDAQWALPSGFLDELEDVLEGLKPQSDVMKNVWLFKKWPEKFLDRQVSHDFDHAALAEARTQAVNEILVSQGFTGIRELMQHAESAYDVGHSVSLATQDQLLKGIIPAMLDGEQREREFAAGFIWSRFYLEKWPWVDTALSLCQTASSRAGLLAAVRFMPEAWERAEAAGNEVSQLYWQRCGPFNPELESREIESAVRSLVKHGRYGLAIDLLSMALHSERIISTDCLFSPLEAMRSVAADDTRAQLGQMVVHGVPRIIADLQERDDADEARLLAIEFTFLRLLDEHSGHEPKTLFKRLATCPEQFVELLGYCYRSTKEDESQEPPEPVQQCDPTVAKQIYHLLHEWKRVPGINETGQVEETILRAWCSEARQLAEKVGRLDICDVYIGQIMAHAPADGDGTWPCKAVRQVATEIGTNSLASGLNCGIHNSRGAVWRGSGGTQERELASKYRDQANLIRFEHPFVAKILDEVAMHYEREAKHWDECERWEE